MRIANHRLTDHWFGMSKDVGGALADLRFIVMHYTAGGSGIGSRDYMMKSPGEKGAAAGTNRYASAHLVVDRDGSLWQIVPFNRKARHAGTSQWKGLSLLNRYSIGIEIANYGWLDRQGDGSYRRSDTPRFDAGDVTIGPMPSGTDVKGWENYPSVQLHTVEQVTEVLLGKYPSIVEVVGHQEISPGRKFDPGPAFPMERFRNLVDGRGPGALGNVRGATERPALRYRTITSLNIRGGPGPEFALLDASPLPTGTRLVAIDEQPPWIFVRLGGDGPDEFESDEGVKGWVHGRYVQLV